MFFAEYSSYLDCHGGQMRRGRGKSKGELTLDNKESLKVLLFILLLLFFFGFFGGGGCFSLVGWLFC